MKIYVSPSTQDWNQYAGGGTGVTDSEEHWCRKAAAVVVADLILAGHTVKMGGVLSATANADDANRWGAELYVAFHTNAGGGMGTEVWYYTGSTKGAALAKAVYNALAPVTNNPDRGVKASTGYIELRRPKAPAIIVEAIFHDRLDEAQEMREDYAEFGHAVARGVVAVAGGKPVTPPISNKPATYLEARIHLDSRDRKDYEAAAAANNDFIVFYPSVKDSFVAWGKGV